MKYMYYLGGMLAALGALSAPASAEEAAPVGAISKWDGGPVFKGDGWEFRVTGRVLADYNFVDADGGADWSAGELRSARIGVSGKFGDNLKYKAEFNTDSTGDIEVTDVFAQWAPTGGDWSVKIGQYKTQNSLDEQTSGRFTSVLERGAFTDAFEFDRRLGVSLEAAGDNYSVSAGVFGDNLNEMSENEGVAIAGRATFNPIKSDNAIVHLGASSRYRKIGDTQSDIRYRQRPFSHIPGRIISTGSIADSDLFVGGEAAAIVGNFWAAGEYSATFADCGSCVEDPTFTGGYAELGVFLGGKKGYKDGKFDRPKVDNPVTKGGMGALALVARFDTIDLTDSGVDGGGYNSYILGADWWATAYTRLSVNLFKVDADLGTSISGLDPAFASLVSALAVEEDVKGAIVRAQFDF